MENRTSALVGKAALHLACFHLARLGYDFTITRENSKTGDLWVDFGERLEVVEVKGMTAGAWQLKADQLARTDRFVFVDVDDGASWLVACADIAAHMGGKIRSSLTVRQISKMPSVALHTRLGRVVPRPVVSKSEPYDPAKKGSRTVTKRLADGTVKVYKYGPYRSRRDNQSTTATGAF
jgi:hypothetical protein